jgi:hypothetical protein
MISPCNPEAHISVNHNKIKVYDNNKLYLKDNTEFEIAFNNDSDYYVKAAITMNGIKQNYALVLRPHQRFYLDRFMDEKKKLKFNTFLTGNDDIEKLKEIIEKNGRIDIRFYKEIQSNIKYTTYNTNTYDIGPFGNVINSGNISKNDIINNTREIIRPDGVSNTSKKLKHFAKSINSYYNSHDPLENINMSFGKPEEIETGRIEVGNKSNQDFVNTDKQFEFFTVATFSYHIMPESHKPKSEPKKNNYVLADDKEFRAYCSMCGRRVKKGWKFCPGCGNKY